MRVVRGQRSWQVDWAGPHGTAWGTVNACASTVSAATIMHFVERWLPLSVPTATLSAALTVVVGVVLVFARAALGKKDRPPLTVIYQVCCWAGAGVWVVYMVRCPHWPLRWLVLRVLALVVMALVAGVAAGLASEHKPEPGRADAISPQRPVDKSDKAQAARHATAVEWEERTRRVIDVETVGLNVEHWPAGNGYSVELQVSGNGRSWRAVAGRIDELAADMDLDYGCRITAQMGTSRRRCILDVMTKDLLAENYEYPDNRQPHSINDPLEVAVTDAGKPVGPNLRQQCMVLAGEAGSGKSNASHCLTAELVTTVDALEWVWDLTAKNWIAWMKPWLSGKVAHPPIDWCAWDRRELLFMYRAAARVGLARPQVYQDLMLEADDDKVPISRRVPEIVLLGDEVTDVTSAMSQHPDVYDLVRRVAFEHRAAGVREILLPLRGTDDVITQSIQSQCQVKGVMRVNGRAEANWIMPGNGFGPDDTPYPGCGGLQMGSGQPLVKVKWYRMRPSIIAKIVCLADDMTRRGLRPVLDEPSRLAANGRNPDGSPMQGLLSGELDCYDTRWERYMETFGNGAPVPAGTAGVAQQAGGAAVGGADLVAANANLAEKMDALDAAVRRARGETADGDEDPSDEDLAAEVDRLLAEGFGPEWAQEFQPERETPAGPDDEVILLGILRDAGERGVKPKQILTVLHREHGIEISRDTLHGRLNALKAAGKVYQPRYGHWAAR